jgi:5,10-methylenetetrahydromethanopterin reductase
LDPADRSVGLLLGTLIAPEQIVPIAALAENLGYNEVWLAEDYFYTAGISAAVGALGSTTALKVGTGIVSALVRHPAVLAMEISTIARMHAGRFCPGIALGAPSWVRQMGLYPDSPLEAVRECVVAVRSLLDGDEISGDYAGFAFDRIKLTYPQSGVPIYMGGVRPRMLRIAGEIADGSIIPLLASPKYVRWAREEIARGAPQRSEKSAHRIVVFVFFSLDAEGKRARNAVRRLFADYLWLSAELETLFEVHGILSELNELGARGGAPEVERGMPAEWCDELAVIGNPEECAAKIDEYFEAGADSVVLMPMPNDRAESIVKLAAADVFPRLKSRVLK